MQIILVLAAVGALAYFVRRQHSIRIRASKRIAFFAFIALNIYAVLLPDHTTWIARQLGIGRGTDLVVYLLVVAFVFGMLNTFLRQREISEHLTNLARTTAIREAELENRQRGLLHCPNCENISSDDAVTNATPPPLTSLTDNTG